MGENVRFEGDFAPLASECTGLSAKARTFGVLEVSVRPGAWTMVCEGCVRTMRGRSFSGGQEGIRNEVIGKSAFIVV